MLICPASRTVFLLTAGSSFVLNRPHCYQTGVPVFDFAAPAATALCSSGNGAARAADIRTCFTDASWKQRMLVQPRFTGCPCRPGKAVSVGAHASLHAIKPSAPCAGFVLSGARWPLAGEILHLRCGPALEGWEGMPAAQLAGRRGESQSRSAADLHRGPSQD